MVRALRTVVTSPTHRGGAAGRVAVADAGGVILDQVLPEPPLVERTSWGPVPDLTDVVRALSRSTTYLLAEVDAAGAFVQAVSARGDELEGAVVSDGRTALRRTAGGGWSLRRLRVGAAGPEHHVDLAERLVAEVQRHQPEVLLVTGTRCAVTSVLALCPRAVTDLVVRLAPASATGDAHRSVLAEEVDRLLGARCRRRDDAVLARYLRERRTGRGVVSGRDAVLAALRSGAVDEVLLADGPEPPAPGTAERHGPVTTAALVWAAVAADAGVTLLPADRTDALAEGAGAILHPSRAGASRVAAVTRPTYT